MTFKAPDDFQLFYDEIIKRCYSYIELGYWDKIDKKTLTNWLDNFQTNEEKYLSSLILHKIIYRNAQAITAMLDNIFQIILPNYLMKNNIYTCNDLELWEAKLFNPGMNFDTITKFRISTITTGDLGESGQFYMRLLREKYISSKMLCDITRTNFKTLKKRHVDTIIFIDDFIGTGTQIGNFIDTYHKNLNEFSNIAFIPLIAHEKGIEAIQRKAQIYNLDITILAVETITCQNASFYLNKPLGDKFDGHNTIKDLLLFYKNFTKTYNIETNIDHIYGFGNLGITQLFSTGTPDNNLPLIYKNINLSWKALQEKR